MIVLLDMDVLIDLALNRSHHAGPAAELLDAFEHRLATAFVSWHTLSNFYYLVAPTRGRSDTRNYLLELTQFVAVAPTTTDSLRYACRLDMKDFEDAIQVAAAVVCGAEVVATRNIRDYAKSPIRASTPKSLLHVLHE